MTYYHIIVWDRNWQQRSYTTRAESADAARSEAHAEFPGARAVRTREA